MDDTVGQPPTGDDRDGSPRHRRFLAGIMAVVLLAAGVLATVLISDSKITGSAVTGVDAPLRAPPATRPKASQPFQSNHDRATRHRSPPRPPQRKASQPFQPNHDRATRHRSRATPTTPAESLQDTPEQLQQAITDYYALMPENLPAAWKRLTANYQQNHSGGFTGYQNFWNPVQRVTVLDVSAKQDGTVDATIEYFFKDGRVIEEQTSYGLLAEDGLWKIDSSTVRSSQTKQGS